ncbi:large ATP-binding protein [Streptomyces sp. NPDC046821]|uniref:large ATP-binding protein n=1 Tax=Streptomyces sp. NPDC046821 TaxID=3154702 RepID=UPI0033D6B501
MNPHDAAKRPGAHLVAEEFGVEDPWALSDNQTLGDPLGLVGRMVAEAAGEVDELHGELTRTAQSAVDLLAPVARGEHASMRGWYGVLRTTGPQIELLVARRGAAYEQLTRSIATFRRLQPEQETARPSTAPVHDLGKEKDQGPGRDDGWAIAGDRKIRALEALEAGGVRFRLTGIGDDRYVVSEKAQRQDPAIWPQTVQRLVADGLLHQDTSASLYRPGRLLSLTPQGETALHDARSATPQVSAALSRSNTPATTNRHVESAALPATTPVGKPSRSLCPRPNPVRRKDIRCPPPYSLPSSPLAQSMHSASMTHSP